MNLPFLRALALLRNATRKERLDRDLGEELSSYVELLAEEKMRNGMSKEDARRNALIELGGIEQVKEEVRSSRIGFALETLLIDVCYGLRSLLKRPAFTWTAVLTLALGIGANTAIFSVVNGVLLRSLAYAHPDRLVMVWERFAQQPDHQNVVAPADFLDWQKRSRSFERLAAVWDARLNFTGSGDPLEVQAQFVTANFFPALGVQPLIGRWFTEAEDRPGSDRVAILGHQLWQARFGGSTAILGQQVTISGRPFTVIGVMPAGFQFLNNQVQVWKPLALDPAQDYRKNSGRFLRCVARLSSGVSIQQAQAELSNIARQLQQQYPSYNAGWGVSLIPLREQMVGGTRLILLVLLSAVGFVLLIACANVANLTLARAATRQREFVLRTALGASRPRLIRQLLTESVMLAGCGGLLATGLSYWAIDILIAFGPDDIPRLHEISIDWKVLWFTFAVSLLTGVLFGLVPAIQASRIDVSGTLKGGERGNTVGRGGVRKVLLITEVSFALVLLVGAGLMIRSFMQLHRVDTGFNSDRVLTMRLQLPAAKYREDQQRVTFFKQVQERLAALPGVKTVGAINFLPLTGLASSTSFNIPGQAEAAPGQAPDTEVRVISGAYFGSMGIALIKGRAFQEQDTAGSRVAIINQTFARRFFANQDPIGKRIMVEWAPTDDPNAKPIDQIIGVVGDTHESALERDPNPTIYWPLEREPYPFMTLVIRSAIDPLLLAATVQKEVHAIDPDQPVADVRTLDSVVAKSIAHPRFETLLLGIFAGIALMLASVGLYGVMNYSAAQRTHEIGIRMALGASRRDILRLVLGKGMLLTLAGVAIGVLVSLALTRLMQNLLYAVKATDVLTFLAVSALLALVAFIANFIPAWQASRGNPIIALRYE